MRVSSLRFLLLSSLVGISAAREFTPFKNANHLRLRSFADISRRDICTANGYVDCGDSCMPIGGACCDSNGDYCDPGDACYGDGCCPIGERCTGSGGGTITQVVDLTSSVARVATSTAVRATSTASSGGGGGGSSSSQCDEDEVVCGTGCIDAGWTCCPDGSGGCITGSEYCFKSPLTGVYGCCPTGETCYDASGGGGTIGGNDDEDSTTSMAAARTTSSARTTTTRPPTTTVAAGGLSGGAQAGGNILSIGSGPAFAAGALAAGMALL